MKEEWLFPGAVVPVDVETTALLVAEIKRLIGVVGGMALAQPEYRAVKTYHEGKPVYVAQQEPPCPHCEYHKSRALRWRDEAYKQAGHPLPEPPPECQTEAEKTAFAFGWFKAMATKRTWVGLSDEDLKLLSAEWRIVYGAWMDDFARDIEAKLKEKNT